VISWDSGVGDEKEDLLGPYCTLLLLFPAATEEKTTTDFFKPLCHALQMIRGCRHCILNIVSPGELNVYFCTPVPNSAIPFAL
jgi:hypothetical protein